MTDRSIPTLPKWPFFLGDAFLLGLAWWVMTQNEHPLSLGAQALMIGCVALGAWLAILPFLKEYDARLRFADADNLTTVVSRIEQLDVVANEIQNATAQWQGIQEQAAKTTKLAKEVEERMTREATQFADFMAKANDNEKSHLRLEVDKLRRAEGEWLSITVRLLDHVYALYRAAVRSGQQGLIDQIGRFQFACYDTARRIGLVPSEAVAGDPYHPEQHQLPTPDDTAADGAVVEDTVATGYSFQGQVLRLPVVLVKAPSTPAGVESTAIIPAAAEPVFQPAESPLEPAPAAEPDAFPAVEQASSAPAEPASGPPETLFASAELAVPEPSDAPVEIAPPSAPPPSAAPERPRSRPPKKGPQEELFPT